MNITSMLMNEKTIFESMNSKISRLYIFDSISSTSDYLRSHVKYQYDNYICLADNQISGRGKFNNTWYSPFEKNIYFSMQTRIKNCDGRLHSLSIVISVIVVNTLCQLFPDIMFFIKWPNDIFFKNKKLSGILIDVIHTSIIYTWVVIGIGINVNMDCTKLINSNLWISLFQILNCVIDRNEIIVQLIHNIIFGIEIFNKYGFIKFVNNYLYCDYFKNHNITLHTSNIKNITGKYLGINNKGHILILHENKVLSFYSGEAYIAKF